VLHAKNKKIYNRNFHVELFTTSAAAVSRAKQAKNQRQMNPGTTSRAPQQTLLHGLGRDLDRFVWSRHELLLTSFAKLIFLWYKKVCTEAV